MNAGTLNNALMSVVKKFLKSLFSLLILIIFALLLAAGTEAGSKWAVSEAFKIVSEQGVYRLSMEDMDGALLSELSFQNLSIELVDVESSVTAGSVVLNWSPLSLFQSELKIQNIQVRQVVIDQNQSSSDSAETDIEAVLQGLYSLPVSVLIENFEINNIVLRGGELQRIASIAMSGEVNSQTISSQLIVNRDAQSAVEIQMTLAASTYILDAMIDWRTVVNEISARGSLNLSGNLQTLIIDHVFSEPAIILSTGTVKTGLLDNTSVEIDLQHAFQEILTGEFLVPMVESINGNLTTTGTLEEMIFLGDINAEIQGFESLNIVFDLQYTPEEILANSLDLISERLSVSASGFYSLVDSKTLNMDWVLNDFTDESLFEGISFASLTGNGNIVAIESDDVSNPIHTSLVINSLAGEINGFPLVGSGEVQVNGSDVEEIQLELQAGDNSVAVTGILIPEMELEWQLQAPMLSTLLESLRGEISGEGKLSGTREQPRLEGNLSGSGIAYQDESYQLTLAEINAQARYEGDDNQIALRFLDFVWGLQPDAISFSGGELLISGTPVLHNLELAARSSLFDLQMLASGGYQNKNWIGLIPTLAIQSSYGDWHLSQPVSLDATQEEVNISPHCWAMASLSLCGQSSWQESNGMAGRFVLENFSLAFLNNSQFIESAGLEDVATVMAERPLGVENLLNAYAISLPENSFIDGRVDLDLSFSGLGGDWATTDLAISATPKELMLGLLVTTGDEIDSQDSAEVKIETFRLNDVRLEINRAEQQWNMESSFDVYIPESGGLDFQGAFAGQGILDENENLSGLFELDFNNIAWLEAVVPNLLNPVGELSGLGEVQGNLSRPLLVFDAQFSEGSFELPEYGLFLENISLSLHSVQDNEITIEGQAVSGEGQITFNSVLTTPFSPGRTLHLAVSGEDFKIIDIPGVQAIVNPDLSIEYTDKMLAINGALIMPLLDLNLNDSLNAVGTDGVSLSRDVVITNMPPELAGSVDNPNDSLLGAIPVSGNVMLGLGEQVRFRGFGLDLNLAGDLLLEQKAGRSLLANGELGIPQGSYSLYGQNLKVLNGKLIFLGNPLNPALDIRAFRETRNAQVGLQMNGTLNNLQGQLFSTPALPESEILSLLITGRSFHNIGNQDEGSMLNAIALLGLEKGQGLTNTVRSRLGLDTVDIETGNDFRDSALGLGKYLSPNLFMRYDIGLFDRENTLTLEYSLSESLKLEVGSGVSQSVDLTYTVEK